MSMTVKPELENQLRARAEAAGITVEAYLERLLRTEQETEEELETLALEGIASGEPMNIGPGYWEKKHRELDERLENPGTR